MVTQQETSTPMQDWVAQALEKLRPILDGDVPYANLRKGLMDLDVGEDAMSDALDRIEWLVQHFKVLPEPCHIDHSEIFKAGGVAVLKDVLVTMEEVEHASRR